MKRVKYVAASDINEAWMRFKAKLFTSEKWEAHETAELLTLRDQCEPTCEYKIYEVRVEIEEL